MAEYTSYARMSPFEGAYITTVACKIKQRGFEKVSFEQYSQSRKDNTEEQSALEYLNIKLPNRADEGSCGYDFYAPRNIILEPYEQLLIWTGVKAYMQSNEVLVLNVRSNQGKHGIRLANTQGWIDSTYYNNQDNEGNIGILLRNDFNKPYEIKKGERFCQGMFGQYLIVDNDTPINQNRSGGFGSSGK